MEARDHKRLGYTEAAAALSYEPVTGVFRWKTRRSNATKAGYVAGGLSGDGYWTICIRGIAYKGHRLAWLLHTGAWPKEEIDHINRNRSDNRISNLRESSHSDNQINSGLYRNNKTGYRGVHFVKGRYIASVRRDKKQTHLGCFPSPHEAHKAVKTYLEKDFGR